LGRRSLVSPPQLRTTYKNFAPWKHLFISLEILFADLALMRKQPEAGQGVYMDHRSQAGFPSSALLAPAET
jgi:hypothetical protein